MTRVRTPHTKHAKSHRSELPKPGSVKPTKTVDQSRKTIELPAKEKSPKKKDVKGKGKAQDTEEDANATSAAKKSKKSGKTSKKKRDDAGGSEKVDPLKAEILALGGEEADYELLKDVDSDAEINGEGSGKTSDAKLTADVAKFVKGLKLPAAPPVAQENDGEEEDEEAEEESDDEEEEKETSEKEEQLKVQQRASEPVKDTSIKGKQKSIIEPRPDWYSSCPPLKPPPTPLSPPSPSTLTTLLTRASTLYTSTTSQSTSTSNTLTRSSADALFLQKVLSSGTSGDKLSALTLMVQSSPLHNAKALESLRGMAQKKGREESLKAMRAVVDWWVGGGSPDRKLRPFRDQPLPHPDVEDAHLVVWYFEDWLKKYFFSLLQILETLLSDPLTYVRTQALGLVFILLRDKPEQEHNLLRLLVNKLGDTERPVASKASYYLLLLLQPHEQMKSIVVREVSSLMLRPTPAHTLSAPSAPALPKHIKFTQDDTESPSSRPKKNKSATVPGEDKERKKDVWSEHSKYYGTITLNQIMLVPERDREVARQLINVYFEMFKEILGRGIEDEPAILNATSEAVPEDGGKPGVKGRGDRRPDARKGGYGGKGKGGKGGKKEMRGEAGFAEVEDSSSRLMSAILTGVNRALPFARLDIGDVVFSKHIDTLFLISHTSTFNISLQALKLLQQISISLSSSSSQSQSQPTTTTTTSSSSPPSIAQSITSRYYRRLYDSLHDPRLATSSKQAMYLNLLFTGLKRDGEAERVKAFVRRFVQVLVGGGGGGAEFVAGGLYLLGELFSSVGGLREMLQPAKKAKAKDSADEDEKTYVPLKRDPVYAHASSTPMWELLPLLNHYHPTIQLHASQLLEGKPLTANADLSLNTLSHFLDRFVYRNPKKAKPKGASAMQPAANVNAHDGTSVRLVKGSASANVEGDGNGMGNGMGIGTGMVNEEGFWKRDVRDVPADQVFFHKYFSQKVEQERARKARVARRRKGKGEGEEDVDGPDEEGEAEEEELEEEEEDEEDGDEDKEGDSDETDEEEEDEIWKAMQASMPKEAEDDDLMLDSDDDDADDDDASVEGFAEAMRDADSDEEDENDIEDNDNDGDGDGISLAENSDDDDLLALDDDLPEGLIAYNSEDDEESDNDGEWGGIDGKPKSTSTSTKRKRTEENKKRRKKLKTLPALASYEDYAALIEAGDEDGDEDF